MFLSINNFLCSGLRRNTSISTCYLQKRYLHKISQSKSPIMNNSREDAIQLIFGKRKYEDFSRREKKLVDSYQDERLKEDWVVLPNTYLNIEQKKLMGCLNNMKPKE